MSWTLGSLKTFDNTPVFDYHWALISIDHKVFRKARGVNYFHTDGYDERLPITSISDGIIPDGRSLLLATTRGKVTAIGVSSKSSIKLASSNGYYSLGTVQLDRVEEGDCGSWVIDISNRTLLGMLVASCDIANEAYILPAPEIFAEITKVSDKFVALPLGIDNQLTQTTFVKQETEYRYTSLRTNQIRILTVSPGKPGTPIECYLSVRDLGDLGEYEALSYAWETWDPSSSINLHHHSKNVTPSLVSALKSLRYDDKPRQLWVDAICINQQDAEETSNQVSLMAYIMERATEVCIWLGEENEDSHWAFSSYLCMLGIHNLHELKSDESMLQQAIALSELAERSWFHRRWIIQDICRAKKATLYCGNYTMAWATFADLIILLNAYQQQSRSFSVCLVKTKQRSLRNPVNDLTYLSVFIEIVQNMFRRTENGHILDSVFSLETLVTDLCFLNITIPHDSIYSLLSLAKDTYKPRSSSLSTLSPMLKAWEHPTFSPTVLEAVKAFRKPLESRRKKISIIVDYSKSFAEVCKDFVQLAIHGSKSLDIICRPWAPAVADLPSWVPIVSRASETTQLNKEFVRINADVLASQNGPCNSRTYQASGPTQPTFHFTAQTLCVKGFILDRVYAKKSPALMGNVPPGWVHFLGWTDTSTPAPEKVWRLFVAGRAGVEQGGQLPPLYYQQACTQAFQQTKLGHGFNLSQRFRQVTPDLGLNISQQLAGSTALVQLFLYRVQSVIWGRRLIKTEEYGYVGLAPEETREEDVVAILYGCSVPVILRLVSDPESKEVECKLIGECYIDGMMDGQALDTKDAWGTKMKTFMII